MSESVVPLRMYDAAYERVRKAEAEVERLREALEWINAEPEDPIKVQMWALAALDCRAALDEGDR